MAEPTTGAPEPDAKPPIAAAVIVQGGRVLMVRRKVAEGTLSWQFPAGAVEPGERVHDAAVRETLEETGLKVRAVEVLGQRVHPATGRTMTYTACEVVSGEAVVGDAEEIDEVCWLEHWELATYVPDGFFAPVEAYLHAALS